MSRWMWRCALALLVSGLALIGAEAVQALPVADPTQIEVMGLVSRGEDGAAWLKWGGQKMLVTPGYMIGRDLRVTAVRNDSVVLYRPGARQYFTIAPKLPLIPGKDRMDVIWSGPLPLWKTIRMVALAYGKEYVCHWQTTMEAMPQARAYDMNAMLERVVSPHHRYHGVDGVIFVAPVNVFGTSWQWFLKRLRGYDSAVLARWFPALSAKGTIISDGRDVARALETISRATKVPIAWQGGQKAPLYCSLKNRPWYEILEYIIVYNGFGIVPSQQGLAITAGVR